MTTLQSNRLHVTIFGETNSGKSALFNAITGTNLAIVSAISGTTTDPVSKSMELLPFGAIVLTDTAGLNDDSQLGTQRLAKTKKALQRTDLAIYTIDFEQYSDWEYQAMKQEFEKNRIPFLIVLTKADSIDQSAAKQKFRDALFVSTKNPDSIEVLKQKISNALQEMKQEEDSLIAGLVPSGGTVVLVVPIDSEAPKGRLILPQVRLIRDCLDHDIRCIVVKPKQLPETIALAVHLVVTDSQIFHEVAAIVPDSVPLISFSILMARQKGDITEFLNGIQAVRNLNDGDCVLISEVCTHNHSHEDIGRVKIPNALRKITQKELHFEFTAGRDFMGDQDDRKDYALIVHCGGCMITQKEMLSRIRMAKENQIPITNYGIVLAYASGVLERSIQILSPEENL